MLDAEVDPAIALFTASCVGHFGLRIPCWQRVRSLAATADAGVQRYAASHVQHMQKALEQMNVKLTEVVRATSRV